MNEKGLEAVANPSALFLTHRDSSPGVSSAVTVQMEGTRPMLLEVQALCSPTQVHSRTHSLTHSLPHSLSHSLTHSLSLLLLPLHPSLSSMHAASIGPSEHVQKPPVLPSYSSNGHIADSTGCPYLHNRVLLHLQWFSTLHRNRCSVDRKSEQREHISALAKVLQHAANTSCKLTPSPRSAIMLEMKHPDVGFCKHTSPGQI